MRAFPFCNVVASVCASLPVLQCCVPSSTLHGFRNPRDRPLSCLRCRNSRHVLAFVPLVTPSFASTSHLHLLSNSTTKAFSHVPPVSPRHGRIYPPEIPELIARRYPRLRLWSQVNCVGYLRKIARCSLPLWPEHISLSSPLNGSHQMWRYCFK